MREPDAELVAAAARGSQGAFQQLVERHQQAVRSFLRRVCDDPMDADDLAQETFLTAWSGLSGYRGGSALRSWLCGIAWKKALTLQRSRRRERRRIDEIEEAPPGEICTEARLDLAQALRSLPSEQRAAVALCLGGDFSHADAAHVLGLPLGTIKSHVQRGRAKLLEALGGQDD